MPGALRETKLTDFFQRRPSLLSNDDFPLSSSQSLGPLSSLGGDPTLPIVAKRKPGRPKGSRKRARQTHDEPVQVSSKRVSLPRGTSSPSSRQRPGKPKRGTNKAVKRKEAYPTRLSLDGDSQDSHSIHSPFPSTPQHRPRVSQKENSYSPQAYTPPRLRADDDNDIGSITSSSVPLSLYYTPQQVSPPGSSRTPDSSLTTDDLSISLSNKRCYFMSPRVTHCLQAPVTPKGICRNEEIVPTSQSSEVGLYSPVRPDVTSRSKSDVHDSVEIWRHGRGTYRCDVSPLRFVAPNGDYSMEIDRPLSPLTSCPPDTGLGSPLSSFTHTDGLSSDIQLNDLPTPLPQHVLPSPTPKPHPTLTPISTPPAVHPVTPPPSSPEQEWPSPVPVVPKDSTTRTAEIIAEIWANVRAKSASDSEESFLRAPVKDTLSSSSEEEDDEPIFLKRVNTAAHHATLPSLRSPSLPPPSHLPTSSDSDESDDQQCVPPFSNSDPISPSDRRRRSTRTRHLVRVANSLTQAAISDTRKANPIKAMLRERKREASTGGGIDALNRAEVYDHNVLLSDFSINEVGEPDNTAALTRSSSGDERAILVTSAAIQADGVGADTTANAVGDEVQQDDRERLLGAKEGEAVGKILDADRRMGQITTHSVLGVSVFVNNHEDAEHGTDAHPNWELATDKTITLEMLSEAIKQKDIGYMQAVFGILTAKDMVVPGVAQWLCEQALWYGHESIGQFSWNFLLHMPLWARSYPGSPLSVALLVQTMMRLGLRKDLRTHVQPLQNPILSCLQNRPRVLRSMVKMIASFASRWSMEQLPDVVITLLLVGVDKDTTTELRRDILHSLSLLCCQLPPEPGDATEISVVEKVLALTKPLSTPNQELLLSFFTKGSPSCLRIARAVAYYVLTGSAVSPASYALPPLGPLITVLSDPEGLFGIMDSTDYDALTSRVAVLGVALSRIESYVIEESTLRKLAQMPEGSPRKKEPVPLELIRTQLDAIHGKIFDTRAAHLDRSRTKGAIQRLSMRVHYQRAVLSKTRGQLSLGDFFSPGGNLRQPKRKIWS